MSEKLRCPWRDSRDGDDLLRESGQLLAEFCDDGRALGDVGDFFDGRGRAGQEIDYVAVHHFLERASTCSATL